MDIDKENDQETTITNNVPDKVDIQTIQEEMIELTQKDETNAQHHMMEENEKIGGNMDLEDNKNEESQPQLNILEAGESQDLSIIQDESRIIEDIPNTDNLELTSEKEQEKKLEETPNPQESLEIATEDDHEAEIEQKEGSTHHQAEEGLEIEVEAVQDIRCESQNEEEKVTVQNSFIEKIIEEISEESKVLTLNQTDNLSPEIQSTSNQIQENRNVEVEAADDIQEIHEEKLITDSQIEEKQNIILCQELILEENKSQTEAVELMKETSTQMEIEEIKPEQIIQDNFPMLQLESTETQETQQEIEVEKEEDLKENKISEKETNLENQLDLDFPYREEQEKEFEEISDKNILSLFSDHIQGAASFHEQEVLTENTFTGKNILNLYTFDRSKEEIHLHLNPRQGSPMFHSLDARNENNSIAEEFLPESFAFYALEQKSQSEEKMKSDKRTSLNAKERILRSEASLDNVIENDPVSVLPPRKINEKGEVCFVERLEKSGKEILIPIAEFIDDNGQLLPK